MSRAVHLSERARRDARCAICHDGRGALDECLACHSLFHAECRSELARCPTLGCSELTPGTGALHSETRGAPSRLAPELAAGIPTGAVLGAALLWARWRGFEPMPLAALLAATLVHWFVLPSVLVARWRTRVPAVLAFGGTVWTQLGMCVPVFAGPRYLSAAALMWMLPLLIVEPVVVAYVLSGAVREGARRRARGGESGSR